MSNRRKLRPAVVGRRTETDHFLFNEIVADHNGGRITDGDCIDEILALARRKVDRMTDEEVCAELEHHTHAPGTPCGPHDGSGHAYPARANP